MFRVGQRVCRIAWMDGIPCMRFATVTKTNSRNYYVDGAKKLSDHWFATSKEAFEYEYRDLFSDWGISIFKDQLPPDWSVKDTVRCVCRLRRLERRLDTSTQETECPMSQETTVEWVPVDWDLEYDSELGGFVFVGLKNDRAEDPIEGREEFVRDNAMALLKQRDEKIDRMRQVIVRLEKAVLSLKGELKKRSTT